MKFVTEGLATWLASNKVNRTSSKLIYALMGAWLIFANGARAAQEPNTDPASAEAWVWGQLIQGREINLETHCHEAGQAGECDRLNASFVAEILSRKLLRDQLPSIGLRLIGAHIAGNLNLADLSVDVPLLIGWSRLDGDLLLRDATFHSVLAIQASTVEGRLIGDGLNVRELFLGGTNFMQGASLINAKIEGRFSTNLAIGVTELASTSRDRTTFRGGVDARYISFAVGFVERTDIEGGPMAEMNLKLAKVAGDLYIVQSNLNNVDLFGARIGGSVYARSATIPGVLAMSHAIVDGAVDLQKATLSTVQFIDAVIKSDLILSVPREPTVQWTAPRRQQGNHLPLLDLQNAHVGAVQDSAEAWPHGFPYKALPMTI